jgi:lysophospholipase L1-like esterase
MFHPRYTTRAALFGATAFALIACADSNPVSPSLAGTPSVASLSEGHGAFQRYVAIGTSISMGNQSDGTTAESQSTSWPAQLARMAGREMTLPLIDGFGCRSPLKAPLALGVRTSGEGAGQDGATLSCAPNVAGVELPTQNLAINAARVRDALFTTPENVTDAGYRLLYPRVLPPGETQLSALLKQNPKIVSIEFGANEVLGARSGIALPGALVPVAEFAPLYTQLVTSVAEVTKYGIVMGLIRDVATFPAFRRGSELYADRATFLAAFNVAVSADCDGSDNLLFVPVRVPTAVATGAFFKRNGLGVHTLSCAGAPPHVQDYVLTPTEAGIVNAQLAEMSAHIRAEADNAGFAYTELEELYGRADIKGPYSVLQQMLSGQPYGPLVSFDGYHPSAEGQRILAEAAARALDDRYGFGILSSALIASR